MEGSVRSSIFRKQHLTSFIHVLLVGYVLATQLRQEPEGGYTVIVPTLEGCITYGETLEEAKTNAKEAIELYIDSLKEDHLPIPSDLQTS